MSTDLTIVLVEDNIAFREEMADFLRRQQWHVHGVDCGEELSEWLHDHTPDIAILDVNLPYEDGYSIAERLRESLPQVGIIMLTARSRLPDRSQGYVAGADVYLSKPTRPDELVAVIQSLARRLQRVQPASYELRRESLSLRSPSHAECKLTSTEFVFLELLALSPQRQAHREYLLEQLEQRLQKAMTADALMVSLSRLRTKCQQQLGVENLVAADRGVGYRLTLPLMLVS